MAADFSYLPILSQEMANAPLVEKVTTDENNHVFYMGYPRTRDLTKCCIKKVTYTKNGNSETWETKLSGGNREQIYAWADRATLTYEFYQ